VAATAPSVAADRIAGVTDDRAVVYGGCVRIALALVTLLASACEPRCKQVVHARAALAHDGAPGRAADVRVTVPFARANDVIAGLLAQEPLTLPIDPPDLGGIAIATTLSATVERVRLQPAAGDRVRFAIAIAIDDRDSNVTDLEAVLEVQPVLTRGDADAELAIGLGPQALVGVTPSVGDARRLRDAVVRWLPEKAKDKVPPVVLDRAVGKLAEHLTGRVWNAVRERLGPPIGDVTRIRVRLPDVPVASTAIRSTDSVLVVDIVTDLPVRRGLGPGNDDEDVGVRVSGSAAAELANWAIDRGYAPRWYSRAIEPRPDGEFRPRFDYRAEDRAHPLKVYSLQERGGCSYFRVGVRPAVALDGERLEATAFDRTLELQAANPVVEAAAWTKYFLTGWIDRSKTVVAHTRLTVGGRTLETRLSSARLVDDELRFALRFGAPPR
jgi:hypothetical protein